MYNGIGWVEYYMGMIQREVGATRDQGGLSALCRGGLEGWEGLLLQLAVASRLSAVEADKNAPPFTPRGKQTGTVMGRQMPSLKGSRTTNGKAARRWVGTCGGRGRGEGVDIGAKF